MFVLIRAGLELGQVITPVETSDGVLIDGCDLCHILAGNAPVTERWRSGYRSNPKFVWAGKKEGPVIVCKQRPI